VSRTQMIAVLGGVLEAVALAYFVLFAARPEPIARILLRRGYEQRGWTEARLASRVRLIGVLGAVVALAAILLAIAKFIG
jgi:hypothetical protein